MIRKTACLTVVLLAIAGGCPTGDEICRDNGVVVRCRPVGEGAPLERCHRNWRGELICRPVG